MKAASAVDRTKSDAASVTLTFGIESVEITPDPLTAVIGKEYQFQAAVDGHPDANKAVDWSVEPTELGTITLHDVLVGAKTGVGSVRAMNAADSSALDTAQVSVVLAVDSVTVSPSSASLEVLGTIRFEATVHGHPDADRSVQW